LLADYLGQQTGVKVTRETVRVCLHAHGYGGLATDLDETRAKLKSKRATWEKTAGRGVMSRDHSI
jgi:hypothetical protein